MAKDTKTNISQIFFGVVWLVSALSYCSPSELVDICLIDSIYVGHQEGILGVDKTTINEMTERPCILKIETYSNCLLSVEPHGDDFTFGRCPFGNDHSTVSCTPGCDYLFMFDAYYRNKTLKFYEGSQSSEWFHPFKTMSSSLYVGLCHTGKPLNFQLKYTTEDKWTTIESSSTDIMSRGKISSPFFPESYMQNSEHYTYYFKRKRSGDYVDLKFDDWNLAPGTEFFFENSNIAGPVSGKDHRPVVVSDSGHDLRVIFNTGRTSNSDALMYMGYKATYRFVSNTQYVQRPLTQCGGYYLNSVGGIIEFSSKSINAEFYDCLWVVKTYPGFTKTYLKLIEFKSQTDYIQDEVNYFAVRRGLTSDGELIGKVYPKSIDKAALGFVDSDGFYVRLIGKFTPLDSLKLSYASYTDQTTACVGLRTFRCSIGKCISAKLQCDGVDHCGDNSDENIGCTGSDTDWTRSHQYTITVSVIIPMVIAIFLIIILCVLFVLVRRCRQNQLLEQARRDGIPSVSAEVSNRQRRRRRRNGGRHRDAPPSYEEVLQNTPYLNTTFGFANPDGLAILNPPSYDEAIGALGAVNTQESNEMIRPPQQRNVSPASSTDSSHSDLLTPYHRNLTSLSSDSTDSSRMRPSVHSYSMSYSSDSEMDSPRVNREVRGERSVIDQPSTSHIESVNKVTEQDLNCCQVSEQEVHVGPKTDGNKSQSASRESEQSSSIETSSSSVNNELDEGCHARQIHVSDNEQRAGPSVETSRTSASTQTKKKRNRRKRNRSKRQESVNSEQEVVLDRISTEAVEDSRQEVENSACHSASAMEADTENLSFDFSHFNVNSHPETGHDNLAFCDDSMEDNIGNVDETMVTLSEDQSYQVHHSSGANNFEPDSRVEIEEHPVQEQLPMNNHVAVSSNSVHIDSLPVQSPDGQTGCYLTLLREGNDDEDIYV